MMLVIGYIDLYIMAIYVLLITYLFGYVFNVPTSVHVARD